MGVVAKIFTPPNNRWFNLEGSKSMKNLRLVLLCLLVLTNSAVACLWDLDTLAMERTRFPGTLEIITGKFARHSLAYYQWRVENRLSRLKSSPNDMKLMDDLAVAYDKLGQHELAIKTMESIRDRSPSRYETIANLGTFQIHAGNLQRGLSLIEQAIEINPDAHFGREVYQGLVVRYVLAEQVDGKTELPLEDSLATYGPRGFAKFVLDQQIQSETDGLERDERERVSEEIAKAIKGVSGMMRFGKHDSPILLECLGDLLLAEPHNDNKRLAVRAYLRASHSVADDRIRHAYHELARDQLHMQTETPNSMDELPLETVINQLAAEVADAQKWAAEIENQEKLWIADGRDVDSLFAERFYKAEQQAIADVGPVITLDSDEFRRMRGERLVIRIAVILAGIILFPLLLIGFVIVMCRRASAQQKSVGV